jgi:prepilin-type N-terminal cleavage/methylation domain-containing protein
MKQSKSIKGGFTLVELMVVAAIIAMASGAIFLVLDTGMKLYAKNASVNITHDQARIAYLQMMQDVQGAVSLIVSDGSPVSLSGGGYSSTGQAISFQVLKGGPFVLAGNINSGDTSASIAIPGSFNFTPVPGQRLVIPSFGIEADITGVTGTSGTTTLALLSNTTYSSGFLSSGGINATITASNSGTSNNFGCFITDRVTYLVSGTPSGSNLGTWFASIYPTTTGSWNKTYANLIGSGTNQFFYVYHNAAGTLTAVRIAQGLVNPLNLGQPLAPFVLNTSSALSQTLTSSSLTSNYVVVGNIATADTLHYSTIKTGTNMNVNGLNMSGTGTALVFSRGMDSIGLNMCITGGTLQMINWENQIAQDRPH